MLAYERATAGSSLTQTKGISFERKYCNYGTAVITASATAWGGWWVIWTVVVN